mmetsp:Transcript_33870/g.70410  ORF Transcript_33870/g.70410 Transcript_33870/m.70410 type:complete len:108 (-) Transcript_33870:268-591(-)
MHRPTDTPEKEKQEPSTAPRRHTCMLPSEAMPGHYGSHFHSRLERAIRHVVNFHQWILQLSIHGWYMAVGATLHRLQPESFLFSFDLESAIMTNQSPAETKGFVRQK